MTIISWVSDEQEIMIYPIDKKELIIDELNKIKKLVDRLIMVNPDLYEDLHDSIRNLEKLL